MAKKKRMPVLPVEAYTSKEWFDREQETIFSKVWRYAGFSEDVSEPGQYISVQAGKNNLFVVMGKDRRLRAFHNICRHRGTQLLRSIGKSSRAITCPYHDWTYSLEGELISVPQQEQEFPNIDKKCHGLIPASVDVWRGMIFVHPEPDAGSIMEWFGDVEPYLGPHRVAELVEYKEAATETVIHANWKIVVENYIDHYHLSHLHSGTLAMYDHAKAEFGFVGPHFAFWEPLAEHYAEKLEQNAPMPLVVDKENAGAWVPMLFPGIGLGESESSWSVFIIEPISAEKTVVRTRTKVKNASEWEFTKQEWKSSYFWFNEIRGKYKAQDGVEDPMTSGDFMAEDVFACEQQQKALHSPYFEHGPSAAKGEEPVRQHQEVVLRFVQGAEK